MTITTRYSVDIVDYGPLHVTHTDEFVELDLADLDWVGATAGDSIKLSRSEARELAASLMDEFEEL